MAKKKNICAHYRNDACPYVQYRVCPYKQCYLPENNKRYWFQLVYLLIAFAVLIKNPTEFTFFSLLLYAGPILLDLINTDLNGKVYNIIRYVYIVLNAIIVTFCMLGVFGFLVDKVSSFIIVETSLIFPGVEINKQWIVWPMVVDVVIPILLLTSCPNKKAIKVFESLTERGKVEAK